MSELNLLTPVGLVFTYTMIRRSIRACHVATALLLSCFCPLHGQQENAATLRGVLQAETSRPAEGATVLVESGGRQQTARTDADGNFAFGNLAPGSYSVAVRRDEQIARSGTPIELQASESVGITLQLTADGGLLVRLAANESGDSGNGGERLAARNVAGLPLNKRDFSQLLLLAAGTKTDTNGTANFTQQFAVNGQRGSNAVFAMDGIATTDPELGGATFSNYNVDAIQEIRTNSGAMPAEIGQGAASFTNVITKSGTDHFHGAIFEFVRNAAFDARNFFDRRSIANPGRLPPFQRNEFGLTSGGPLLLPGIYDGSGKTYYFAEYQGFRQVLGTTQILSVPTLAERHGLDSTAFPGDTLMIPVDPRIAAVLARYPLPNDPEGPYGARTFATSSKVTTQSDQFSIRIDHRISDRSQLFVRFSRDNVNGPITNPDQTAIDPSFATRFLDHQRNFGLTYTRVLSPHVTMDFSIGYERSTPLFPPSNTTQPALQFADNSYISFDGPGGSITGAFGNLYQLRQNVAFIRDKHLVKTGIDIRVNRDTVVQGFQPNGLYTFGGGAAYSPVGIPSLSGLHDIQVGDPLPDALSGFLTATPFSYDISVSPGFLPQGDHLGWSNVRRESYDAYIQDTWKASTHLSINYGLRYEVNTPPREAAGKTSGVVFNNSGGVLQEKLLVNLQPTYPLDWGGWGPRLAIDYSPNNNLVLHASGSIINIVPNLNQTNSTIADAPFVSTVYLYAAPGSPIQFENAVSHFQLPVIYTIGGQPLFANGRTSDVPAGTQMDVQRFENDLAALTPDHQIRPLSMYATDTNFRNGYIAAYSAGFDRSFGAVKWNTAYVGTVGVDLPASSFPNGYGGADQAFAPFTTFDAAGRVVGGFGSEFLVTNRGHSSFNSLQTGIRKASNRNGLGFGVNYTFSKSLDDTSAVFGGGSGSTGVVQQTAPQNPQDVRAEKAPSVFDVRHVVSANFVQEIPFERWLRRGVLPAKLTSGWQLFGLATFTSGLPFSVYSGIQQTAAGSNNADRPDQVGVPVLSTSRTVREDYFGLGANNASFFYIPIHIPGGSGPNQGRFGTLGRDTFRGPAFHNVDVSLVKDTPLRGDALKVQFRAEFFNVFNVVNFGQPANVVLGPGFGIIHSTAGTSRQIQFSLKLLY